MQLAAVKKTIVTLLKLNYYSYVEAGRFLRRALGTYLIEQVSDCLFMSSRFRALLF